MLLLGRQQDRRPAHDPVQPQVNQPATQSRGQPDQHQPALHAADQVLGFLVDFDHRRDVIAVGIEQRNVVFDEDVFRGRDELLFHARMVDIVITGRHGHLRSEGLVQVFIDMNRGAHQGRIGRPDDHAVGGIDVGEDHVRQVFDVIEEFAPGVGAGQRIDLGKVAVLARVEQLAHGPHVGNRHVAHLGGGDRLDELRRQQRIALHAFGNHEFGRYRTQRHRHGADHRHADQRKPAQQVERLFARAQSHVGLVGGQGFGKRGHWMLFPEKPYRVYSPLLAICPATGSFPPPRFPRLSRCPISPNAGERGPFPQSGKCHPLLTKHLCSGPLMAIFTGWHGSCRRPVN
ncbi:hypothetical protein D3C87_1268780 [compost metagenome]